jgi:hypothetical protein
MSLIWVALGLGHASAAVWGFRNFDSCLRILYTILLPDEQLFRNLLYRSHIGTPGSRG